MALVIGNLPSLSVSYLLTLQTSVCLFPCVSSDRSRSVSAGRREEGSRPVHPLHAVTAGTSLQLGRQAARDPHGGDAEGPHGAAQVQVGPTGERCAGLVRGLSELLS